jgi:hypothetical protein
VRFACAALTKPITGIGIKPNDRGWLVPMCADHHEMQHRMGEKKFWEKTINSPLLLSLRLFHAYETKEEYAHEIIKNWLHERFE